MQFYKLLEYSHFQLIVLIAPLADSSIPISIELLAVVLNMVSITVFINVSMKVVATHYISA